MKTRTIILALLVVAVLSLLKATQIYSQEKPPGWQVYFSPSGGATAALTRELNNAQKTVLVQAYKITSTPIAKALTDAHNRGISVDVILDKNQRTDKYSSATFLSNAGIAVLIDAQHKIAHNKVIIIDSEILITGSFNFTKAAEESNAENLLIIRDKRLANIYTNNWRNHAKHSHKYKRTIDQGQDTHKRGP